MKTSSSRRELGRLLPRWHQPASSQPALFDEVRSVLLSDWVKETKAPHSERLRHAASVLQCASRVHTVLKS